MRLRNLVATCAVSALATVFSVQQGEHGPLVVYKLQVPESQPPAVTAPPPAAVPARGPRVLGTVVMPASAWPPAAAPQVRPVAVPLTALLPEPPAGTTPFRVVEEAEIGEAMINWETGEALTLQDVNDAALWRRETADRLRGLPIAPRF